ncbi:glucose-1-phosphate adenylyltransferase [Striga asiatica]|uniref:Glucose-1-phosphate adenylyltransferase n=1 Tax=Striga asiatica TaxID=4170 RepID=A0A5A7PUY7_STRAF|nr:glucose-1-phosphate adenylyltransferase [Striga asiatica]
MEAPDLARPVSAKQVAAAEGLVVTGPQTVEVTTHILNFELFSKPYLLEFVSLDFYLRGCHSKNQPHHLVATQKRPHVLNLHLDLIRPHPQQFKQDIITPLPSFLKPQSGMPKQAAARERGIELEKLELEPLEKLDELEPL